MRIWGCVRVFRRCQTLVWLSFALMAAGCATSVARMPVPAELSQTAQIPGLAHARFWGDEPPKNILAFARKHMPAAVRLATKTKQEDGRPVVEYLALSGGAGDGAYGAGLLVGWTQRGTRPEFEVVTGVSSGALIAPFAFLGPAYDRKLTEIWTMYQTQDLATPQVLAGLLGAEALADSKPLAELIAKYVNRAMLERIAHEYRVKGRMLLVGTTNLDAQRPVIWNMGELAASPHPHAHELFRQVLLASVSLPGVFPPVHIKVSAGDQILEEMHVDGGPTRQVFLAPAQLSLKTFDVLYARPPLRRIYIVKNGKLAPEYQPVRPTAVAISERSLFTLTKSQSVGDINRIYFMARRDGAEFRLSSIPAAFNATSTQAFDADYMKKLFAVGVAAGRRNIWATAPPDAGAALATR